MSQPAADPGMPDLRDFMCFAVYSANHAFGRLYKPLLDELGLTYPQYLAMVSLGEEDGQTVGAIGQTLFLGANTLTPILKRLEALGYVTRQRDSRDERRVLVHLTDKGRDLLQEAKCVPPRLSEAFDLSVEDTNKLRGEILALRDRLLKAAGEDLE